MGKWKSYKNWIKKLEEFTVPNNLIYNVKGCGFLIWNLWAILPCQIISFYRYLPTNCIIYKLDIYTIYSFYRSWQKSKIYLPQVLKYIKYKPICDIIFNIPYKICNSFAPTLPSLCLYTSVIFMYICLDFYFILNGLMHKVIILYIYMRYKRCRLNAVLFTLLFVIEVERSFSVRFTLRH